MTARIGLRLAMLRTSLGAAIVAVAILVVGGGAGAQVPHGGGQTVVPRVVGLTRADAALKLRQAGLIPTAFRRAVRYEPLGDGSAEQLELVRARRAGRRFVTAQAPRAGQVLRRGSWATFATQQARGYLSLAWNRFSGAFPAIRTGPGGRQLLFKDRASTCQTLDHIDIAIREQWVLVAPYELMLVACPQAARPRLVSLMLPEPLRGRPVLEQEPAIPDPALVDQRAIPIAGTRTSIGGRSIVVYFHHGSCQDRLVKTEVDERPESVVVTVIGGDIDTDLACTSELRTSLTVVRLDSPLGARRIVDGSR